MEHKSILIKDTTREEREQIVDESFNCGDLCSSCCACGGLEIDYQQYIDGKKELSTLNAEYHANYMQSGHMKEKNNQSCLM
jgi:hypothetical protein